STYVSYSARSHKYQREDKDTSQNSPILQALIPVMIVILPFFITVIINYIFTEHYPEAMNEWVIDTLDFVILAMSFHGTAHSIALLLTTPAFRVRL
ncbi:hypothetical protein PENTCL1PPCAC_30653, partial [Pristionchus entomophagus]